MPPRRARPELDQNVFKASSSRRSATRRTLRARFSARRLTQQPISRATPTFAAQARATSVRSRGADGRETARRRHGDAATASNAGPAEARATSSAMGGLLSKNKKGKKRSAAKGGISPQDRAILDLKNARERPAPEPNAASTRPRPRRRRDSSTDYPRRSRGVAATRPRTIHVPAAASTRLRNSRVPM